MKIFCTGVIFTTSFAFVNFIGGCMNPQFFRFPNFGYQQPQTELQSYSQHDPFPSNVSGPRTEARPPGFTSPRTIPRQLQEQQLLRGMQGMPQTPNTLSPPQLKEAYPNVVPH